MQSSLWSLFNFLPPSSTTSAHLSSSPCSISLLLLSPSTLFFHFPFQSVPIPLFLSPFTPLLLFPFPLLPDFPPLPPIFLPSVVPFQFVPCHCPLTLQKFPFHFFLPSIPSHFSFVHFSLSDCSPPTASLPLPPYQCSLCLGPSPFLLHVPSS